jgi:hypothetical protein
VTQKKSTPKTERIIMITPGVGFGAPVTRAPVKSFWKGGGMASVSVLFGVNRSYFLGVGLEGVLMPFSESAFAAAYPAITPHEQNLGLLHLFLEGKYTPFARYRLSPYAICTLGGARLTNADYLAYPGGTRVIYYGIRGITRLATGIGVGADFLLNRTVIVAVEGKATYVHNDPNIGLWLSFQGGVRFVL